MRRAAEVMHGRLKQFTLFIISLGILFFLLCDINNDKDIKSNKLIKKELVSRSSDELLKNSTSISYPDDISFTPLYLANSRHIIGEAVTSDREHKQLISIEIDSGSWEVLKEIKKPFEKVSFIVHVELNDHLIFEEFDSNSMSSIYYDLSYVSKEYKEIHRIYDVTPIHFTQTATKDNEIILSIYSPEIQGYKMYQYNIDTSKMKLVFNTNSGFPTFFEDSLYYISIDGVNHKTSVIKDCLNGQKTEILSTTSPDKFLFGLYSDDHNIIKLMYDNDMIEVSGLTDKTLLFKTEWMETVVYKNGFLSYLGDGNKETGYRLKYYLLDLKNNISYEYNDSIMLLSDKGILWVEYKKSVENIEKGKIFNNENSIMRFYKFP